MPWESIDYDRVFKLWWDPCYRESTFVLLNLSLKKYRYLFTVGTNRLANWHCKFACFLTIVKSKPKSIFFFLNLFYCSSEMNGVTSIGWRLMLDPLTCWLINMESAIPENVQQKLLWRMDWVEKWEEVLFVSPLPHSISENNEANERKKKFLQERTRISPCQVIGIFSSSTLNEVLNLSPFPLP